MLSNSLTYLLFFPIIFIIYWSIIPKNRNIILLTTSYFFHMSWEPVCAILIIITSLSNWECALLIDNIEKQKKFIITLYPLILFTFKYYNFVIDTIISLSDILLPVGISFYTFLYIGYIIDAYRKKSNQEGFFGHQELFYDNGHLNMNRSDIYTRKVSQKLNQL